MTHRPSPWTRTGGALLAASALVPAAAAWYVFDTRMPDDAARSHEYAVAATCPAGSPGAAVEECVRTVPFTVNSTVVRPKDHVATVDGAPFWSGTVQFINNGPLLEDLKPGDQVNGTLWRGHVTRMERAGVAQSTAAEPRDEAQIMAGLGTFLAMLAVLAAALGTLLFTGRPITVALARSLFFRTLFSCFAPAALAYWVGLPWWTVPIAAVLTALIAAEAVRRLNTGKVPGEPQGFVAGRLPA
ncbi:hypothetical protein [Kitasatospora sp. SUK 42]|uniref:hypothetical protein n=1 Tax=Kitasatospora sp. SUK 42 TaxID=1588882 RepID=UPI0018CAB4FF|nr:hypothetical protein [Kitasatospora sp. SUK 42]MBV2155450.1 hypothetical protein [Kitasatospora sp. SUK 42]